MAHTAEAETIEAGVCTWNRGELDSEYLQAFISRKLGNIALAAEDLE